MGEKMANYPSHSAFLAILLGAVFVVVRAAADTN
jgi:hypothetical protein